MEEMNMVENVEAAATEETAEAQGEQQAPEKKYSDADVDRIVARKIAAERKRMSKLFQGEQQESELEKRERAVLLRELKADAKDALIDQGLPQSLAGLLNYTSEDNLKKSMAEVSEIFRAAVQQGVKDKLRGETPRRGNPCTSEEMALHDAFKAGAR